MDILNKLTVNNLDKVTVLPKDFFYPYNHFNGETNITDNTICIHHFGKTWVDPVKEFVDEIWKPGTGMYFLDGKVYAPPEEREGLLLHAKEIEKVEHELMFGSIDNMAEVIDWPAVEWPTVSIVVPVARQGGLKRLLESVDKLHYPKNKIKEYYHSGDKETVPEKIRDIMGELWPASEDYICYMADDTEFTPDALRIAVKESLMYGKALVAFNTGTLLPDEGNACEHFIIRRDFIPQLENGQIFSTDFTHVGCDNWLWAQAKKLGQAYRSEKAEVIHHHFSKPWGVFDEVYEKAWNPETRKKDRETLKRKLATL